ncbi:MAG TPA: exopolyphosphatase, partial [Gammaproteobacteria bacterium]|nr:exopolyphosphatase [Gammaproteobacteria bacterium]
AIFEQVGVEKARFSDGAMREGILYDMLGRHAPEDVRERTVRALMKRYSVDETQAERVQQTAMDLFRRVEQAWDLGAYCQDWLNWSALCHEIGLVVSHSGYHRHGAYLLSYSDLPGFTRQDQKIMATLVGCHRRKVRTAMLDEVLPHLLDKVRRLIMLLRLAVVFNRSRRDAGLPVFSIAVQGDSIHLAFEPDWINRQPLLLADLQQEQDIWKKLGATLDFE